MTAFTPLIDDLAGCFKKTVNKLTAAQRARVAEAFPLGEWDAMSATERLKEARAWDERSRPMNEAEIQRVSMLFSELAAVEAKEKYWSSRTDDGASDALVKQEQLGLIRARLAELVAEQSTLRGDDPSVKPPAAVEGAETPQKRRARLLDTLEHEVSARGVRGALERTFSLEKLTNPKADRSYIGKQVAKARKERGPTTLIAVMPSHRVVDGKRQS